jgi:Flp pilus assembly protein TadD
LQLAFLAIDAKDTTSALTEMDLAVQLRGDDAAARYLYGFTLASAGKLADAEVQLKKSVELNSVYAAPHFVLGQVMEAVNRPADAAKEYTTFLAIAAKSDVRRDAAEAKVTSLGKSTSRTSPFEPRSAGSFAP